MNEQEIHVGQIWRRKRDGKQVRIVSQGLPLADDDWAWEGHDYRGRGQSYGSYIRRGYELVSEP